jgi:hemerythrin
MDFIEWNDNFSVNVKEIDQEHQGIFKIINKLLNSIADDTSNEILGEILDNVTDYIESHFKTEEHYFDKFNYAQSASHKEEHNDFREKVAEFKESFKKGRESLHLELTNFLMNWLVNHILISDKAYSQCFNENGLR